MDRGIGTWIVYSRGRCVGSVVLIAYVDDVLICSSSREASKWKSFRMSYEGLVTQALSGDDAACNYLEWLTKTYGAKYLTGPVRTQGTDLAGYVLHLDVEFPQREEPVEFRRQLILEVGIRMLFSDRP